MYVTAKGLSYATTYYCRMYEKVYEKRSRGW